MKRTAGLARSGRHGPLVAFAVDLDRTLLPPGSTSVGSAVPLLTAVQHMGLKVVLVSGRGHPQLTAFAKRLRAVDALVAENGAVIEAPIGAPVEVIGRRTAEAVRRRLASAPTRGAEYGAVVASFPRAVRPKIRPLLRGLAVDFVPNVDRVMVLPAGVAKASGMRHAMRSLHLRSGGFAAIGDAENDVDLLRNAELAGAVQNAVPKVRLVVDYVSRAKYTAGVKEFVHGPLADYLAHR